MNQENRETQNPFLQEWTTPHGTIPFDKIHVDDFEPALKIALDKANDEIERITSNPDAPTFENTIEALAKPNELLDNVCNTLFNLMSAETNDQIDEVAQNVSLKLTEHSTEVMFNKKLFARVKAVYEQKPSLNAEETMLLNKTYNSFVRSGANLSDEDQQKMKALEAEKSQLTIKFSQNNLKENAKFILHITNKDDLAGLPESSVEAAKQAAEERSLDGWVFTLEAPSYSPFLTYADKRELREKIYRAYNTKCFHDDEFDNKEIVKKLVNIRREKAQLLGFGTYAEYTLKERMAGTSENVYKLLNQLLEAYKPTAFKEIDAVKAKAKELTGSDIEIMPWDFAYYSNKLKQELHNLNPEMLRPYFQLEKVKKGVFGLATKLYGITFKENKDIPVYHQDVTAYEVFDKDGSFLAVLYTDFHPRKSKRSGAWMTSFKEQYIDENGVNHRPHVSIVMNLTKPTPSKPALLTLGEIETFLHEFGHALHGMFANTKYAELSGTNVWWDFVELPSQFMENYAVEPDFLNTFASHFETGEPMPSELIDRIIASRNFNCAYACLRQVSFGLLDMAYYTKTDAFDEDIKTFEQNAWKEAQVLPVIPESCMTVQFGHIMSGGYSAGYYSYKWAEVLDADAFSLFKQTGIFNTETAEKFRREVLSKGGTEHPMELYKRFRGQEPSINALLKRNAII